MKGALRFHTLDVFTNRRRRGNPLIVFEGADRLTDAERVDLANEFNFPVAVFLGDSRDPLCAARIHVHAPLHNGALSGHAAIGAAILIAETRASDVLARNEIVVALEMDGLTIRCEVIKNRHGVSYAQCPSPPPAPGGEPPQEEELARLLGLDRNDVGFKGHRPLIYAAPHPIVFVPVASRKALDRATLSPHGVAVAARGAGGVYLYTRETEDETCAIAGRMFAQPCGAEDPATGLAAAAFAGVAMQFEKPEDGEHQIFIEQGQAMGRASRMTLRMSVQDGRLAHAMVGGQAVRVSEGVAKL